MSKSKEIATINKNWQEVQFLKCPDGCYFVRCWINVEDNLKKGEGKEMFNYLLEHHGVEYHAECLYASVESAQDIEDVLERLSECEDAINELSDVIDQDVNVKLEEEEDE